MITREQQVIKVMRTASLMQYQPGQDYDYYYPSVEQLHQLGHMDESGNIKYNETDLAFLAWTLHPIDPDNISNDQKQCMTVAAQLLNDYIAEPIDDDEEEKQAMAEILRKYNQKHSQQKNN